MNSVAGFISIKILYRLTYYNTTFSYYYFKLFIK